MSTASLSRDRPFSIGVDIGGTTSKIGIVTPDGLCLDRLTMPTQAHLPLARFIEQFTERVAGLLNRLDPNYRCRGMGIAAPGASSRDGEMHHPTHFCWQAANLEQGLRPYYDFPIRVINDATAAAMGEKRFGAARGFDNFVVLTLGTGLGGGIFTDGKPLLGSRGLAGELGHMTAVPDGRWCGCGRRGCLETYVSATGLCRTMDSLDGGLLARSGPPRDARRIWEEAVAGDARAREAFEITGSILGRAMADLVPIFDPEAFILFGGLTGAGDLLLDPARRAFHAGLGKPFANDIPILFSQVPDNQAAILGAGHLFEQERSRSCPM